MIARFRSLIEQCFPICTHTASSCETARSPYPPLLAGQGKDLPFELFAHILSFVPPSDFLKNHLLNKTIKGKLEERSLSDLIWQAYCESKKWSQSSHSTESLPWKDVYQNTHIFLNATLPNLSRQHYQQTTFSFPVTLTLPFIKDEKVYLQTDGKNYSINLKSTPLLGDSSIADQKQVIDLNPHLVLKVTIPRNQLPSVSITPFIESRDQKTLDSIGKAFPHSFNKLRSVYQVKDKFISLSHDPARSNTLMSIHSLEIREFGNPIFEMNVNPTGQENYTFDCFDVSTQILAVAPAGQSEILIYDFENAVSHLLKHPDTLLGEAFIDISQDNRLHYFYKVLIKDDLVIATGINKNKKPAVYVWNWKTQTLLYAFGQNTKSPLKLEASHLNHLWKSVIRVENNSLFVWMDASLCVWNLEDGEDIVHLKLNIKNELINHLAFVDNCLVLGSIKKLHVFKFDKSLNCSSTQCIDLSQKP
ncbi:hypothetical protein PNK_1974 [Candidatus Protochlamydia naegleriophila]|uniref:F-box domain-containing protein n=1 Tax=Candidatus Protochlamydia naegleriophila TaxID=389348 RepID=A0A0U5JFH3_9BACT|nr:hypothetical protein [Candidatus Protochlamydia naegleriophila]CUI17578.1 hypothetical protein PNK_1974 [Candidatus Protochlamydia naegleriophila]